MYYSVIVTQVTHVNENAIAKFIRLTFYNRVPVKVVDARTYIYIDMLVSRKQNKEKIK